MPKDTNRQKISGLDIYASNEVKYSVGEDNFGNRKLYGLIEETHDNFEVTVSGTAQTGLDIFAEYSAFPAAYSLLKVQTSLTTPGEKIREYHKNLELETCSGDYEKALRIMHTLHYTFLALGRGVCQDYAHIMLSLLRMEGIPARYVVGMMQGEDSSHAWAEALCNGYWYGFDPTNHKLVNDDYIRVSCGRDSGDCSVIRGSFYGCVTQKQTENVK